MMDNQKVLNVTNITGNMLRMNKLMLKNKINS